MIKFNSIQSVIFNYYGVENKIYKNRVRKYAKCLQLITYFAKIHTNFTDVEIAELIMRDRSTVIHNYNLIKDVIRLHTDKELLKEVNE